MSTPPTTNPTSSQSQPKIQIIDDKSPHCIPFILSLLKEHLASPQAGQPFILGLNGIQGSGKTTLVSHLSNLLSSPPHNHPTLVLSIDDLYLPYAQQVALAKAHPENKLVQHRGEPGTHDILLAIELFEKLREGKEVKIPSYDKSLHSGAGDRVPEEDWRAVNKGGEQKVKVIILEGWLVGFSALSSSALLSRISQPSLTLEKHTISDLEFINTSLSTYTPLWQQLNAFIHIDAEETQWVYTWREEQEAALRLSKGEGAGMSKEKVVEFVDGYFPAYELYVEGVREGVFRGLGKEGKEWEGRQLRLVVGMDRRVRDVVRI